MFPVGLCRLLQVSVTHFTLVLQRPFIITIIILQSAIYDNEIFHFFPSNFINSALPANCVARFKNKNHFFSCFDTFHMPF